MRAGLYLRISEDRTGDELGVTRQRGDCVELVARRGWTLVGEYPENDTSAAGKVARPQFAALLDAVKAGQLDVIVAWSLDRLVRTARDRLTLVETCQEHGVTVALCRGTDMDPTTPGGRLIFDVLGGVAAHEIAMKADRQRSAGQQRAKAGLPWGPRRPFGYLLGGMELDPVESSLLRSAYREVLAGASLRGIAAQWNEAGVKTTLGSTWRAEQLGPVLLNPRNAGLRAYGGEILGKAQWPEVVDEQTWRAAVSLLRDPTRRVGASRARKHLLGGLALCGRCGKPLGTGYATSTRKPVYRCRPSQHLSRAVAPVDELVRDVVVARLARPDLLQTMTPERPDTTGLDDEVNTLRARLDSVATEFADGDLTASQLRTITDRIKERLAVAEAALMEAARVPVLTGLVGEADAAERFDRFDLDRRRAVIDALLQVTILPARGGAGFRPDSVRIDWR